MQCQELEDRLNRLLDARRSIHDDRAVVVHTVGCESCAATLSVYQLMLDGIAAAEPPDPSEHFVERILASRDAQRVAGLQVVYAAVLSMAVAAAILISLMGPRHLSSPHQPQGSTAFNITPEQFHDVGVTTGRGLAALRETVWQVASDLQVNSRIRPITEPVQAAWHVFRRVLPDSLPVNSGDQETSLLLHQSLALA